MLAVSKEQKVVSEQLRGFTINISQAVAAIPARHTAGRLAEHAHSVEMHKTHQIAGNATARTGEAHSVPNCLLEFYLDVSPQRR